MPFGPQMPPLGEHRIDHGFEARVSPKGTNYDYDTDTRWVRVAWEAHVVERGTFGASDPGTLADRLLKRLQRIATVFAQAKAIVAETANPAMAPGYLRKLDEVECLWGTKGTTWREAFKRADFTTRRFHLDGDAKAQMRALLLNIEIGGEEWAIEPGTPKSRKRLAHRLRDRL